MADYTSVLAVGSSIARYLTFCFKQNPPLDEDGGENTTNVVLAKTEDFEDATSPNATISQPCLSLFMYRIDFNKVMRAAWSSASYFDGESHLPLDLHFLITAWAGNAENEYRIIGRAMQCIENSPILTGPLLDPITNWSTGDSIQLCMEELSNEEVMRIFDSLPVDYKLSIPYVARVLVLDGGVQHPEQPVSTVVTGATSGIGG